MENVLGKLRVIDLVDAAYLFKVSVYSAVSIMIWAIFFLILLILLRLLLN